MPDYQTSCVLSIFHYNYQFIVIAIKVTVCGVLGKTKNALQHAEEELD